MTINSATTSPFLLNPSPESKAPRSTGHDTPELKQAFTDFVGQTFFGEMMKQMRSTLDKPAFFHGGMREHIFQRQLDQVLVERLSDSSSSAISDPLYHLPIAPLAYPRP